MGYPYLALVRQLFTIISQYSSDRHRVHNPVVRWRGSHSFKLMTSTIAECNVQYQEEIPGSSWEASLLSISHIVVSTRYSESRNQVGPHLHKYDVFRFLRCRFQVCTVLCESGDCCDSTDTTPNSEGYADRQKLAEYSSNVQYARQLDLKWDGLQALLPGPRHLSHRGQGLAVLVSTHAGDGDARTTACGQNLTAPALMCHELLTTRKGVSYAC